MLRSTKCPHCKKKLPDGYRIHPECVEGWYAAQSAKQKAAKAKADAKRRKMDRATDRARRRALETIPELIKAAQREFNAYIRARDKDKPCICCGRMASDKDLLTGSRWDAGHYRSTGSASHLRFHEDNCHRQLVFCNRHGAGRAVDYRLGLIARIGLLAVEALETNNAPKKWERDELRQIAATYKAKLKELEKQE
jgi:hypothetical protein